MSRDVIDLIDGVIERHGDAMRWSPEPPPPYTAGAFKAQIQDAMEAVAVSLQRVAPEVRRFVDDLNVMVLQFNLNGNAYLDSSARTKRLARLRRMHHLYRMRRR